MDPRRNSMVPGRLIGRRQILRAGMLAGTGVATGLLLPGCGSDDERGGGSATAGTMQYMSEETIDVEVAWYDRVKAAMTDKYPQVTIKGDHISTTDLFIKLQTQIASGAVPDLLPKTGVTRGVTLYKSGLFDPVDDVIEAIGADKFDPAALKAFEDDGAHWGVPFLAISMCLWYRTDIAEDVGATPPKTWDDMLTFAEKMTIDTNGDGKPDIYGVTLPFGRNSATARMFLTFIHQAGGGVFDENLKVAIDSAAGRQALEFMRELARYSPPDSLNYAAAEQYRTFMAKRTSSTFYYGRILALADADPSLKGKVAAVANPYSVNPYAFAEHNAAYVFKNGGGKAIAKTWLKEFEYRPDLYLDFILTAPGHNGPLMTSVTQDPKWTENALLKSDPAALGVLQDAVRDGGNFAQETPDHQLNIDGGKVGDGYIIPDMVQAVLVNGEDPQAALRRAAADLESLVA